MEFDKKSSSSEAELAYLGPRERVDTHQVLKDNDTHVSGGQVKGHIIMILDINQCHMHHASTHYAYSTMSIQYIHTYIHLGQN